MSRQELAEAVNAYLWDTYGQHERLDGNDIGKLERGDTRWPGERRREAFRAVLRVQTDAELGFYIIRTPAMNTADAHHQVGENDSGETLTAETVLTAQVRSNELTHPATLAETLPDDNVAAETLDDLATVEARRRRAATSNVDEAKLLYLEEAVRYAIAANERQPPVTLAPRVRHLRGHVGQLLEGRQHPPQRRRLYAIATYLSGLLGALALDLSAFGRAAAYGCEAFELADAVEDPDLQAWTRAVQSLIAYYSGNFHDALAFARDGQRRAPGSPHTVRLAVNGEARALARLGDRYGVDEAVGRAFDLVSRLPASAKVSESLALGAYCAPRAAANAATAYLALGAAKQATDYTLRALTAFDQAGLRGPQALSRLDLATAALHDDEPEVERACALVVEAITLTRDQRFESVNQRAREFLGKARPWAPLSCVRDVRELVAAHVGPAEPGPSAIASSP